jgi:hypothetical protein
MITSDFISKLRREVNDNPVRKLDKVTGDGSTVVYKTLNAPIRESSYSLYYNNTLKSEGVSGNYTINLDTGIVTCAATTTDEVKIIYDSVNFRDQNWLEAIQSAFYSLGDQFYRSVIRSTSGITLSAGVQVYDCPSSCIRLLEALQSDDYSLNGGFAPVNTNTRYDRRANKLIFGGKALKANYLAISYLRKLTPPTATTSVLDVEDNWLELLKLKAQQIYFEHMAAKVSTQGNAATEEGFFSVANLRTLARDKENQFELLKRKLKPVMPASQIPYYIHGGGAV